MNILLTGGSGFIGTRLIGDLLQNNHTVTNYDVVVSEKYPNLTIIGDVRDERAMISSCKDIDVIYNLAAEHADDVVPESLYADVNIGGAINVVAAAKANNVKNIVFTGSVAVYGLNRGAPNESMDAQPFNEYGRTKYEAEKIFIKWANEDKRNALTILRPAVIFGENNRGNVFNLMNQIANNKFLMIGNGNNHKSMGYVGNITAFLESCLYTKPGINIFNYADKPDLTTNEIIQIIKNELNIKHHISSLPYFIGLLGGYAIDILAKVTRRKFPVSSIRIKKFCAETTINTDKLFKSGFKPPYTLEQGLRLMIQHDFKNRFIH